jgi:hypothetical protein
MTSQRKIIANRSNSQRSSGPTSAVGKRKSSRNSRKHGLAALTCRQPAASPDIERLATTICSDDQDPVLLAKARIIAETDQVLRAVRGQKLALIERMREATIIPLAKDDNSLALAKARFEQSKLAQKQIDALLPKIFEKYKDQLPPMAELTQMFCSRDVIAIIQDFLEESGLIEEDERMDKHPEQDNKPQQRDEYQAMQAAAHELNQLERYECRAWSRLKGAIRDFVDTQRVRGRGYSPGLRPTNG